MAIRNTGTSRGIKGNRRIATRDTSAVFYIVFLLFLILTASYWIWRWIRFDESER